MLTIGRLGTLAGLEPKTLRYYDRVGLVRPSSRTPAGYRLYDAEAADRLHFIARAKGLITRRLTRSRQGGQYG